MRRDSLPPLLTLASGVLSVVAPPLVAFTPGIGPGVSYRLPVLRNTLSAMSIGFALGRFSRRPTRQRLALVAATMSLTALARLTDPKRFFVALTRPPRVGASETTLGDEALVLGYEADDQTLAWPIELVAPHHLINDLVGQQPVLASY